MSGQVDEPLMPSLCSSAPVETPGEAPLDEEGGELLAVDLGEDGEEIGEAGVGDELLRPGEPVVAVRRAHRLGLGAERVAAGARLGERVGGDQLAGHQARAGSGSFCSSVPKKTSGQRADAGVRAPRDRERRELERALADQRRAGLADAEAAVVGGDVEHQKAELAGLLEQAAHHARRLRLDRVDVRQHLAPHEVLRGGGDLLIFRSEVFVSEAVADGGTGQEAATGGKGFTERHDGWTAASDVPIHTARSALKSSRCHPKTANDPTGPVVRRCTVTGGRSSPDGGQKLTSAATVGMKSARRPSWFRGTRKFAASITWSLSEKRAPTARSKMS